MDPPTAFHRGGAPQARKSSGLRCQPAIKAHIEPQRLFRGLSTCAPTVSLVAASVAAITAPPTTARPGARVIPSIASRAPTGAPSIPAPPSRAQVAWARLPNEVARDRRLGAAALVLLAYRATFIGNYRIIISALLNERIARAGLSRHVIQRAMREIIAAGHLDRRQAPSRGRGTYGKARRPDVAALPSQ